MGSDRAPRAAAPAVEEAVIPAFCKEAEMTEFDALHPLLQAVVYYGSPLLLLAGLAGFATSVALWFLRAP